MNRKLLGPLIFMGILVVCLTKPMSTSTSAPPTLFSLYDSNESEILHDNNDNDVANSINDDDRDKDYRQQYAAKMLTYMNHSIDPCDDFYEYACGNWKNTIPPRQAEHKRNSLLDVNFKLDDLVEVMLSWPHVDDIAPEYSREFKTAQQLYNNCMQSDIYPMKKSPEYLKVIADIGGFPAVQSEWNASEFSWLNMSSHMSNYGLSSLIKEGIIPQYPFAPYFQIPEFGFDIELHYDNIKNSSSNAYKVNWQSMNDILSVYGVEPAERRESIISEIFEFLQAALNIVEQFEEHDYKCRALSEELDEDVVNVVDQQWLAYHEIAWMGKSELRDDDEKPCVYLYYHLDKVCSERKEAVANYLALKFLYHVDSRLKDVEFQKDFCTSHVKRTMSFFFDHLYMKAFFNNDLRRDVEKIIKDIRHSLHTILVEADWLDEATREAALQKEAAIAEYIGRYEDTNMTKLLLAELKNLKYEEDNYDLNNLNMRKFKQSMKRFNGLHFEQLGNDTKPLELLLGMQVNAFYYNIDNSIYVTAGILHPPAFHKAWPNALKYGTIGYLVGHEFTHGFDTVGSNYDANGNNNYWWSSKSGKVFEERSECYVEYYQNYSIPEINRNINGNLTKDENIADGGGLRMAYMAYRRNLKEMTKNANLIETNFHKEEQMPGLDLSPEQLFFLGAAQLWCSSYKEAHYWEELSDEHTIDKYRVLGLVSNNEEFAKAFNCPIDSKMNPSTKKCEIW
ncbi:neprilysin [Musca domestica]|uniref:Neprilysin n=1 Tax=Musca domestica TaxID=7370 RepID=A0A1I8M943_MUSDO|nr:neprilysin [Musca domestica]XP_058983090.1 neprilysin [Musca domestica]